MTNEAVNCQDVRILSAAETPLKAIRLLKEKAPTANGMMLEINWLRRFFQFAPNFFQIRSWRCGCLPPHFTD